MVLSGICLMVPVTELRKPAQPNPFPETSLCSGQDCLVICDDFGEREIIGDL